MADKKKKFVIVALVNTNALDFKESTTIHESYRSSRKEIAKSLGEFVMYRSYIVNTGHPEGLELHTVTTTGVIIIVNLRKEVVITYLIARPGQLTRYGITDPKLIALAYEHQRANLNYK